MDAVLAENLVKSFGAVKAVDNISLTIKEGEIFGFLGPNGAGKTTTIRMITGVLIPDFGNVRIFGTDIHKDPLSAKLNMGIIPENGTVYADLTALQNVLLTARFYGMKKNEREMRANEVLENLGLSDRKNSLVRSFSKGMRQRVCIAAAIVHSPRLLILDEPTTGLDVYSRRLVIDTVREMNSNKSTILLTTHNIEEANALCSKIAVINRGRIAAAESPENLKKRFDTSGYVEVAFDRKVSEEIFSYPGIEKAEHWGDKWRIYSEDTDMTVKFLSSLAEHEKLKFVKISTSNPSLEEAFVKLTEEA